jgi:hypothetical protein
LQQVLQVQRELGLQARLRVGLKLLQAWRSPSWEPFQPSGKLP